MQLHRLQCYLQVPKIFARNKCYITQKEVKISKALRNQNHIGRSIFGLGTMYIGIDITTKQIPTSMLDIRQYDITRYVLIYLYIGLKA